MRHLLNTLFVTTEDAYAALDGENVVVKRESAIIARFPLHTLQGIFLFSYMGASPALMGACADRNINLVFCSPNGKFLARICGESSGNVLLRRTQYRYADNETESCLISRAMVFGKVSNARACIERTIRDHPNRIDCNAFKSSSAQLKELLPQILETTSPERLRGLEGASASIYFDCVDDMILSDKEAFYYRGRSRRPPTDNINALLSFTYSILGNDCAAALESAGLDSYVGFMHTDRPGRKSLALDLMEELRPCFADRFVLTLVNNRVLSAKDFVKQDSGAVMLGDDARKTFFKQLQARKKEIITHPFLKEKIPWGLVPYVQALLLARYLRGDLDAYPPFLWK